MDVVGFVDFVLQQRIAMPMVCAATPVSRTARINSVVPTVAVENAVFATRVKIVRLQVNASIPTHANPTAPTNYAVRMVVAGHAELVPQNCSAKTVNA